MEDTPSVSEADERAATPPASTPRHIAFADRPLRDPYAPDDRGDRGERRGLERGSRVRDEDIDESWPDPPNWADPKELDKDVLRDLRGLSKEGAEYVALHMVAATGLAEEDPELAWRHARAARSKGGRIAVVRETVGLVAYRAGEWADAIAELRAARRMGGGPGHVAILADCERALGNPEKALEIARSPEAEQLDAEGAAELRIVVAGARADLGQVDAALAHLLQGPGFDLDNLEPYSARLYYAYADLLLDADRDAEALEWFVRANDADEEEETDAEDRIAELLEARDEESDDESEDESDDSDDSDESEDESDDSHDSDEDDDSEAAPDSSAADPTAGGAEGAERTDTSAESTFGRPAFSDDVIGDQDTEQDPR